MDNIVFSLNNFEYFLLILVRIASFIFIAPIFGQNGIPRQIKIGLSFFISIFMYNIVEYPTLNYGGLVGYSILVLKEGITGLLIGFVANICSSIVLFAGNIIDMDIGLSMATEFNPEINNQVTVTGNLYYYSLMLMLLATNMHIYVLRAVCDSFQLIPIGGAEIQCDQLMITFSGFMTDLMVLGFRIFLPCFACIMILNCILGVMAKVAPQMNMFSIGMQLKILVGLTVLFLTVFLLPQMMEMIFDEIKLMVGSVIESIHK